MESNQWFNRPLNEVYGELGSSYEGLPQKIARRRASHGDGLLARRREGIPALVARVFADFSPGLLILIAVLAIVMGQGEGAVVILSVTGAYLLVSILLNIRSQAVIESMCGQRVPRVQVLRNGRIFYLLASAVVPGDVLLLAEGDIVPADCRILASADLFVHEGGVTGNAFSVPKFAVLDHPEEVRVPERMSNMLFALSKVTHGSARAIAVATGEETYVVRTRGKSKLPMSGNLKVFSLLDKYARLSGLIVPAIAFVLMLADILLPTNDGSLYPIFLWGFSLCAASASFLYQLLGRAAAASALEHAAGRGRDGAIITDLEALERLGTVDTVLFPAESALLTEKCRVASLYYDNLEHDARQIDEGAGRDMLARASALINAMGKQLSFSGAGANSPVLRAVVDCALDQGADSSAYPVVETRLAGGDSRFHTALFCRGGLYSACSLGDAAELLPYCTDCFFEGTLVKMTPTIHARASQIIAAAANRAHTVLAVTEKKTGYNNLRRLGALQTELTLLGFVIVEQEVSSGFAPALNALYDAGIMPIMLTAEQGNEANARNLALSLGIADRESQILTGAEVAGMSDRALMERATSLRAVICVGGDERFRLVSALLRAGRRPAYIGAETCDVAAATAAPVSFACAPAGTRRKMEILRRDTDRYGSQILKMLSSVTIRRAEAQTGGLAAVVNALLIADGYYRHLRGAVAYLLSSQWLRIVIAVIGVCTRMSVLTAAGILVTGLLVDTFAILAFSRRREEQTLPPSGRNAGPGTYLAQLRQVLPVMLVTGALAVLIPVLFSCFGAFDRGSLPAAVLATLLLCQLVLYAHNSCAGNVFSPAEWRGGVVSGLLYVLVLMFLFLSVAVAPVGTLFGLSPVSAHDMLCSFVTPLLLLLALETRKFLRARRAQKN